MFFCDEINVYFSSGKGGKGSNGFYKFKNFKNKKPYGGNGGRGGDVYLVASNEVNTLDGLKFYYKAEDGLNGGVNFKNGKNGKDLYVKVPLGVKVIDNDDNILLGLLLTLNSKLKIVSGGRGGYGNVVLRKYNNSLSLISGVGASIKHVSLELIFLSNVALFGYVNAGKSFFFNNLVNTFSKVSSYPCTTVQPKLGILKIFSDKNILLLDLPGVLKNKYFDLKLNLHKYLNKVDLFLHFIDVSLIVSRFYLIKNILYLYKKLNFYNINLIFKTHWLILHKSDLFYDFSFFNIFIYNLRKIKYDNFFLVSSKKKYGLKKLLFNLKEFNYDKKK